VDYYNGFEPMAKNKFKFVQRRENNPFVKEAASESVKGRGRYQWHL